ncbi:hypothetical protein ASAP_0263 [Asaia bogorensis]|uniref:Uncharacterized protein n=1 Tax=Asaia bogorensis TaxID=91915 RepID=A0A060QCA5_9PROT|nr:hypothetical protein ASAP_0263 [Asaia bogorensis]
MRRAIVFVLSVSANQNVIVTNQVRTLAFALRGRLHHATPIS